MAQQVASTEVLKARGRVRLGSWMIIAGSLGAILCLLTYLDVWNVSDTKPIGWALGAALCAVLAIGGFVVLWGGLTEGAKATQAATLAAQQARHIDGDA